MEDAEVLEQNPPLVLYDADCSMCRFFAEVARKRASGALEFTPWQDFRSSERAVAGLSQEVREQPSDRLRLYHNNELYEDSAAWEWLLKEHPDLKGLGWIAEKMGVRHGAAKVIEKSAKTFKRFCYNCGRR